jgi:hypothetical protein
VRTQSTVLKENINIGRLIPTGIGICRYTGGLQLEHSRLHPNRSENNFELIAFGQLWKGANLQLHSSYQRANMKGWNLARGRITRSNVSDQEIEDRLERIISGSAKQVTTYKLVFLLSLLHSLGDADGDCRLSFTPVFAKAARIYWILVVEHGLRQCDASDHHSAVESILLKRFAELGGAGSLTMLPPDQSTRVERDVRRSAKKYVVGAVYGDFMGAIYEFDLVSEYLILNPAFLRYFRGQFTSLSERITAALGAQVAKFNRLDVVEASRIVGGAVARTYLDGLRQEADSQAIKHFVPAGTHQREVPTSSLAALPPRLASLPIRVAISDSGAAWRLERAGFSTLGTLEGHTAASVARIEGLGRRTAAEIWRVLVEIRSGKFDPTLSIAGTLEEELQFLVQRAGSTDAERHTTIIERYRGLRGEPEATLDEIGERLGVTRERVRQLKSGIEEAIENVVPWLNLQVLHAIRIALGRAGGLATPSELSAAIDELIAPRDYDSARFVRWIVARARDSMVYYTDYDLVVGPPLGRGSFEGAVEIIRNHLASVRCASAEDLSAQIAAVSPGLSREVHVHQAELIAPAVGVRLMEGYYASSTWSRADWAEFVIESQGGPLNYLDVAARVNQLSGMDYHDVGFNSVLNADPRFVRVGAGDFALAKWGARSYGRFDEVIEHYLEGREQPVHERKIAEDLLRTYTVTPSTVSAMLRVARDRFRHCGGGFWGLRARRYRVDTRLEQLITETLQRLGPQTLEELLQRVAFSQTRSGFALASLEDVARTVYMSDRITYHGRMAPQRFKAALDVDLRGSNLPLSPGPEESPPAITVDDLFRDTSW